MTMFRSLKKELQKFVPVVTVVTVEPVVTVVTVVTVLIDLG